MLLPLFIIIPILGSLLCCKSDYITVKAPRWIALITTVTIFLLSLFLFFKYSNNNGHISHYKYWNEEFLISWIPRFGINFHLAIDRLSLIMVTLSSYLSILSVMSSWNKIKKNTGLFYFNLLFIFFGTIGVLLAIDFFLFFCFWEIMLIPMYFLIVFWGDNTSSKIKRIFSANKFLIYTQLSSFMMLFSIILLSISYHNRVHIWTFDYNILTTICLDPKLEFIIMLGFFIAFAVKMPIFPFHSWLPNAHSESPTSSSVDLSGMLIKVAVYGLLRFNISCFKHASYSFSYIAIFLGVITFFYASWMAFYESNIKKILAYISISHMGFILVAVYSNNKIAYQGAIVQMIFSSLSSAGLFILFSQFYNRIKIKNISHTGGFYKILKWIPDFFLFFLFANLGIPGTANFIGEFMILNGIFYTFPYTAILLIIGLFFSTIYSLNIMHKIFYGPLIHKNYKGCIQINNIEFFTVVFLIFIILFFGFFPQNILNIINF